MNKGTVFFSAIAFLLPLFFTSCKMEDWKPHLYGPVAVVDVGISDGVSIEAPYKFTAANFSFSINDIVTQLGLDTGVQITVPANTDAVTVPDVVSETSKSVKEIKIKLGTQLTVTLNNQFPVAIKAGTKFTIANTADNLKIAEVTLTEDLPANQSREYLASGSLEVSIFESMKMSFENLKIGGGTFQANGQKINAQINLKGARLAYMELKPTMDTLFDESDKIEFNLRGNDQKIDVNSIENPLKVYIKNQFPLAVTVRLYLYNSLDGQPVKTIAIPIPANQTASSLVTQISVSDPLVLNAKYISTQTIVNSNSFVGGQNITIYDTQRLAIKVMIDSPVKPITD
jgi:hypothetical protein